MNLAQTEHRNIRDLECHEKGRGKGPTYGQGVWGNKATLSRCHIYTRKTKAGGTQWLMGLVAVSSSSFSPVDGWLESSYGA